MNRSAEHGEFLADKDGRPLYLFTADPTGVSTCYGPCPAAWPPLLAAQGTPHTRIRGGGRAACSP